MKDEENDMYEYEIMCHKHRSKNNLEIIDIKEEREYNCEDECEVHMTCPLC